MKTITVNLYQFNELSEEAKQHAIEKMYDINVDYDWWEMVYEDFKLLCQELSIDIDLKKTYFRGFYSQGDGSSFTGEFNVSELIKAIEDKRHLNYMPKDAPDLTLPDINRHVLALIKDKTIEVYCYIEPSNRETSVKASINHYVSQDNIANEIDKLEEWGQEIADELNHWFYNILEKSYAYLTGKDAIIETIISNEYDFTEDGNLN